MTSARYPGIGSFFPYPNAEVTGDVAGRNSRPGWPPARWTLVNSGRAALALIIGQHLTRHAEARLWVPSYYCWDVTRYIAEMVPVLTYPCRPTDPRLPDEIPPDDLLLVTSYFGAEPGPTQVPAAQVLLDITHDPLAEWVAAYRAAWLFGSLRKTLPLPEGGFASAVNSKDHSLATPPPSEDSRAVVVQGANAMLRSRGGSRELGPCQRNPGIRPCRTMSPPWRASTRRPCSAEFLGLLKKLPVQRWRTQRLANLRTLREALDAELLSLALPSTFGLALVLPDVETAEAFRRDLISKEVYPARFWPQPDEATAEDSDLAELIHFVHVDHRYTSADMRRVAGILCSTHQPI